ncbi:phage/plasmid primase, P4 family [Mesorhizobium sp.]|uniref:DNA primase family protein n=1 Tax=Mesorhizobium sp. TaxID=1871066 RepID=UPI000FE55D7D|nr:phage/plasmid primase, P4 family [Mesorhizobium sp.]RWO21745.1 MAG: NTP-binding protein [Mesorhizobium sp.]
MTDQTMPPHLFEAPPIGDPDEYGAVVLPFPGGEPRSPYGRQEDDGQTILDPRDPMSSARAMMKARYTVDGLTTLQHWRDSFYQWAGTHYREADRAAVEADVWRFLDGAKCCNKDGDIIAFQPNRSRVGDVSAALAALCNLPAHVEAPAWLIGLNMPPADELTPVANGLLHLPSGELIVPSPSFFNLNAAGVAFNPDAPKPVEWLRFLDQIWPDDPQSIETLQDVFGYLLSPDTSQQKIPLIVGPKRSGKGTLARVLTGVLGQASVAAPTLSGLSTNFGVEPLIGKSVAIIGDARLGGRADQAVIAERLLQISGEDSLTIDRKHKSAWTGRLRVRFLIMSNELPRLSDASGALAGRFIVLTMENSFFGREDHGLLNRLLPELPGILGWAREGYLRLNRRGWFIQPESAQAAIAELEALGSPIAAFVKQQCTVAPGLQCLPARLFEAWKVWCTENGRKEHGTLQSFGRDLRAAVSGLRVSNLRKGDGRERYYEGIDVGDVAAPPVPEQMSDW